MLKPEQVPDKVWCAFHESVLRYGYKPQALAAAINAWPGMEYRPEAKLKPDDLIERVARAIAETAEPKEKWMYHITEARAAIAVVLEQAERMADRIEQLEAALRKIRQRADYQLPSAQDIAAAALEDRT